MLLFVDCYFVLIGRWLFWGIVLGVSVGCWVVWGFDCCILVGVVLC